MKMDPLLPVYYTHRIYLNLARPQDLVQSLSSSLLQLSLEDARLRKRIMNHWAVPAHSQGANDLYQTIAPWHSERQSLA
eukprot:COSAG06_NODE_31117_length_526_cov_3.306792_1_plen_79_part_00